MDTCVFISGQGTLAAATLECCADHFVCNPPKISDSDILWECYDTPLADDGTPDVEWVLQKIRGDIWLLGHHCHPLILVSSQLPVGTTAKLEAEFPRHTFAHSPENIRIATAVADFRDQARVVVGIRSTDWAGRLQKLFAPFTKTIIFTDPESAEMVKHALNCWLGMNIAFANEIARICAVVGADTNTVSSSLRLDARVGTRAPLKPGAPFGGGHLARDIFNVMRIAREKGVSIPIIAHITESNGGVANGWKS